MGRNGSKLKSEKRDGRLWRRVGGTITSPTLITAVGPLVGGASRHGEGILFSIREETWFEEIGKKKKRIRCGGKTSGLQSQRGSGSQ